MTDHEKKITDYVNRFVNSEIEKFIKAWIDRANGTDFTKLLERESTKVIELEEQNQTLRAGFAAADEKTGILILENKQLRTKLLESEANVTVMVGSLERARGYIQSTYASHSFVGGLRRLDDINRALSSNSGKSFLAVVEAARKLKTEMDTKGHSDAAEEIFDTLDALDKMIDV